MRKNELIITYGDGINDGFSVKMYDSAVEFKHREKFDHKHSDVEVSLFLSGRGVYHLNDGVCDIEAGDVFVFGSNQVHCITDVVSDEEMCLFNIQIEPRLFWNSASFPVTEQHIRLFADKCRRFCASSDTAKALTSAITSIRHEVITKKNGYRIRIYAGIMTLIGILAEEYGDELDDSSEIRKNNYPGMRKAMQYIDAHLTENISLETIALQAGYSRNYFSTLFTSLNGLSPWEYITIKRVGLAKKMLSASDLSVTEIASKCGYENLSNFNRQFKRLTGYTPSEYNRNIVSVNKKI